VRYRRPPEKDQPLEAPVSGPTVGDVALLVSILLFGALPLLAWILHLPAERWELGLGTAMVLCAGAELVRELACSRGRNGAR
jgi:hypothetical protein